MPTAPSQSGAHWGARSPSSPVTQTQEHGRPNQPGDLETPEAELEPPTTPCCVITARSGDACERRPVSTAGELQAEISDLVNRGTQAAALGPAVSTAALGKQTDSVEGVTRPLITIRGLPGMLVSVLLDSPLDIDQAFVEAHAAGTSYRPTGPRRRRGPRAARYAHWDFPELVAGLWQATANEQSRAGLENRHDGIEPPGADLSRQPVVLPVADAQEAPAVVFCRASLWASRDVDVLFLEKPCWEESGPLRKARRAGRLTGNMMPVSQDIRSNRDERKGQEISSLESILQENLATGYKEGGVFPLLEETAYEQWLGLFEVLTPRERVAKPKGIPLEWRILQCLERNINMVRITGRSQNGSGNAESLCVSLDWGGLIQRLQLRVDIIAANTLRVMNKKPKGTFREERAYIPRRGRSEAETPSSQGSDANQRALDRVTYLGGVLLPFSIVSGVLSMNEGFEPGQPLFWVFWVATIPLTMFTVVVIYADKLRQVEVWAEVLDPSGSVSEEHDGDDHDDDDDDKSTTSGGGEQVQETKMEKRKTTPAFGVSKHDRGHQPETVTYGAGGDVVIDLGTPDAGFQQTAAVPPLPRREDRRRDSDQGQGATSSDEDTTGGVALPITAWGPGHRPGWKKKQLGWKGAAMCILRIQKPLWALDGTPGGA